MDVATDDAVVALSPCVVRRCFLESLNVPDAGADAELDSLYERPVGLPHPAARVVDRVIRSHHNVVQSVAQLFEPGRASYDPVEAVAMANEQSLAPRSRVSPPPVHFDWAARNPSKHRRAGVVFAGNIDDARSGGVFRKKS